MNFKGEPYIFEKSTNNLVYLILANTYRISAQKLIYQHQIRDIIYNNNSYIEIKEMLKLKI